MRWTETWFQKVFGLLLLVGILAVIPLLDYWGGEGLGTFLMGCQFVAGLCLILVSRTWARLTAIVPVLLFAALSRAFLYWTWTSVPLTDVRAFLNLIYIPSLALLLVSPVLPLTNRNMAKVAGIFAVFAVLSLLADLGPRMLDSWHRGYGPLETMRISGFGIRTLLEAVMLNITS